VGAIVMFEVGHRYWACIDPSRVQGLGGSKETWRQLQGTETDNLSTRVLRLWWQHFSPCHPNGNRGVGTVYFIGNLAVTFFAVHIDLVMTQWKNGFFSALQAHNSVGFYHQLWDFCPIALASSMATIYSGYLATMWDLRWREELTHDFVGMWLERKAYYTVRFSDPGNGAVIDNFDQRLVDDTAIFAGSSRGLICGFAEAVLRLIVFFPALVRLAPTPVVWQFCIALSLVSSVLTHIVGRPLATQNAQLQRTEADFRSSLIRLRLFAEDIALQRGEGSEGAVAARCFEGVKAATFMAARGTLNLVTYTSAYGLAGGILPLLVLVPSYFSGQIDLGTMFQIEAVVGGVRSSLDFFIGAYGEIATWRAAANRMLALEAIKDVDAPDATTTGTTARAIAEQTEDFNQDGRLEVEDLVLVAVGDGHTLLEQASFSWTAGSRVMLVGNAGCGKTALLRTLAGAWPLPASGRVSTLGASGAFAEKTMLVTSRGFLLPMQTTLRKVLAYPEAIAAFDEDLKESLATCGLNHLVDQLSVEADWAAELSPGDRQRLVFARLLARWPSGVQWLFLDDVAAALPEADAAELHHRLSSQMPADAGLVVVSSHLEVQRQQGWRRFCMNLQNKTIVEETAEGGLGFSAATGETPLFSGPERAAEA
jgi:putative ATP-binding cassette transporter